MTDPAPQNPAELRAEAERVEKLLEGVTPGEWQSGHESVWALGEQGTNRMYILIQPGFDGQHRTSNYELDANARIIAQSKRLARAHADLLRRHAELIEGQIEVSVFKHDTPQILRFRGDFSEYDITLLKEGVDLDMPDHLEEGLYAIPVQWDSARVNGEAIIPSPDWKRAALVPAPASAEGGRK